MAKLKRLATIDDEILNVQMPIASNEIVERTRDYPLLTPMRFSRKYNSLTFNPVKITYNNEDHEIQMNYCDNPFCKWHGKPQVRYDDVKYKPSRYKLVGNAERKNQAIVCNPDPLRPHIGMTLNCNTKPYSNWSIAEEIKRLAMIDRVEDWVPEYNFHRDSCTISHTTPFTDKVSFRKRGKSKGKSQKWQCKVCNKITNILPKREQSFSYNQKRNDVLPLLMKALLSRTPVKRTCEILGIGSQTYYTKLEWLYRRCLEFLERYETKPLETKSFDSMWINTDKMIYYLNNVRKKGQGGRRYDNLEDSQFPTHVVISGDIDSYYVFRSDIAFDWHISMEQINEDTQLFKEDHVHPFVRKNDRFDRFSFFPQPPTSNDTQTEHEYQNELYKFERRSKYIDGLHLNSTYTTFAHLWHIKQKVNAQNWRFVTDDDKSILTALYRTFAKEIRLTDAHHFLCQVDRSKSLKDSYQEYKDGRNDLFSWGKMNGYNKTSMSELGYRRLLEELQTHSFHKVDTDGTKTYNVWAKNPIEHPIPSIDKGFHYVDCTTDISSLDDSHVANMILKVSDRPTSAFMQQIRRRLSILERPLVTARGDGKSYIYSNFNPKYAQYAITILRTYYNFCFKIKGYDGQKKTPAQRLGIADRVFSIQDIIYFK
ncbi:insertion element protein [Aquibacillus sediminis]|uniref:insertion element protein n=1 Tax=Aquibacillus sediminis TaxID=2574734 RepID=UPI0011096969|nr:insertion element protein [Aquibacillus sediminis]